MIIKYLQNLLIFDMGGFTEALPLVIIVAVASGHLGYDQLNFWSRPAIVEWKQNLAREEKMQQNTAAQDRSSRKGILFVTKSLKF